jgi:hypothetical protein
MLTNVGDGKKLRMLQNLMKGAQLAGLVNPIVSAPTCPTGLV